MLYWSNVSQILTKWWQFFSFFPDNCWRSANLPKMSIEKEYLRSFFPFFEKVGPFECDELEKHCLTVEFFKKIVNI